MGILGPNLEQLFDFCDRQFTVGTVLNIGIQLLNRLEWLHNKNFVHRDMKPENILIGQGKKSSTVFLIDFGLAKRFLCPKTGNHIPFRSNKGIVGTSKYLSVSGHMGNEHSRRDDLESLCIIMIYFLHGGKLPWDLPQPVMQTIDAKDPNAYQKEEQNQELQKRYDQDVLEVKKQISTTDLCAKVAPQFKTYLDYIRGLKFDQKPNYNMLRGWFTILQKEYNLEDDLQFDWISHKKNLIDKRTAAEEAEKRAKVQSGNNKVRGKLAKSMVSKMAAIEEAERKNAQIIAEKIALEESKRK